MGNEGHHYRWLSQLSAVTEEDYATDSKPNTPGAGDPHRKSKEDESKDYNISYDSESIYLDVRPAEEKYCSLPMPPKYRRYLSCEIEEVHDYCSSSISSNDDKREEEDYDSDGPDVSYISARGTFHDLYNLMRLHDHDQSERTSVEDSVYVAVGKGQSSMSALFWTVMSNIVNPSTTICLIHVFPETHHVPSPLGLLPKNNVSPDIVAKYDTKAREKGEALLKKILYACRSSFEIQNKVDAVLIQNDSVGKTILKLIPSLKINTLVLGTGKPKTSSKMAKLRKNGIAHEIYMNAPTTCRVKLVCQGKEVTDPEFATPLSSPASSGSPLSSASSSWRSNSTSLSWFKRSKSYDDIVPAKEVKLEKSRSCTGFY